MPQSDIGFMGLLMLLALAAPVAAQESRTSLLVGYGAIDHQVSLGPAFHANLRHQVLLIDSLALSPPGPRQRVLRGLSAEAELFAQTGRAGVRIGACSADPERLCTRGADPVTVLGGGLVSRVDLVRRERRVHLYFLPLSVGVYARSYTATEAPLGSPEWVERSAVRLSGGFGNGLGLGLNAGAVTVILEGRAVLIYDVYGGRGGSLPLSVGVRW